MGTHFSEIYNRFLGKITDDMYLELTPEDTVKDLRNLLIDIIPDFEFPRKDLSDYNIYTIKKNATEINEFDFILSQDDFDCFIEGSSFNCYLTSEEINILAYLMLCAWLQRQVDSIENIRMKYSGTDFKMTSQANHLSKLSALLKENEREAFHRQRLYKRRKIADDGTYISNWDMFRYDNFN